MYIFQNQIKIIFAFLCLRPGFEDIRKEKSTASKPVTYDFKRNNDYLPWRYAASSRKRPFFLCYYIVSCVLLRCNKSVETIFKQSLNSNERKEDGVRHGTAEKKVRIRFDICTIKKPLAVSYNLK